MDSDSSPESSFVTISSYNRIRMCRTRTITQQSSSCPATPKSKSKSKKSIVQKLAQILPTSFISLSFSFSSSSVDSEYISALSTTPILYPFKEVSSALTNKISTLRNKRVVIIQQPVRSDPIPASSLTSISKSNHRSLVKFMGAAVNDNHIYLVYEYTAGSSLKHCLQKSKILNKWISRMQAAFDIAKGLEYIHNHCGMIHDAISISNVIITEPDCNAKICLFGAADLAHGKRSNSKKSDVFDFGVVILELVSGKIVMETEKISMVQQTRDAVEKGTVRQLVDQSLSVAEEVAEKMIKVALQCVADEEDKRPEMAIVAGQIWKLFMYSENWERMTKNENQASWLN